MALHLVTGYKGVAHITASDQGAFNAGHVGKGDYVFKIGQMFRVEKLNEATIRIHDGSLCMQGRHVNMEPGTYVDVSIGTELGLRYDLIVARYEKNTETGVESVELDIIKGSPTDYQDPSYVTGDILSGDTIHEMPLYRLVRGYVTTVIPVFKTIIPSADAHIGFYRQNMLINGDFQCNQRGLETYDVGGTAAYTVDMWRAFQVKVDILNEGVKLTGKSAQTQGYFTQFIPLGKSYDAKYTFTVKVDDEVHTGTLRSDIATSTASTVMLKNKFKITAVIVSAYNNDGSFFEYKLKVNICPINTSTFTVNYINVFEGDMVYPHTKEDPATALMRCRRYVQKGCYASPILHYMMDGSNILYQFAVCFDRMAHTEATKPIVESCSWNYYDTNAAGVSGNVTADTTTSLDGMFLLRTSSTKEKHPQCWGIRGAYLITCEPRDA